MLSRQNTWIYNMFILLIKTSRPVWMWVYWLIWTPCSALSQLSSWAAKTLVWIIIRDSCYLIISRSDEKRPSAVIKTKCRFFSYTGLFNKSLLQRAGRPLNQIRVILITCLLNAVDGSWAERSIQAVRIHSGENIPLPSLYIIYMHLVSAFSSLAFSVVSNHERPLSEAVEHGHVAPFPWPFEMNAFIVRSKKSSFAYS